MLRSRHCRLVSLCQLFDDVDCLMRSYKHAFKWMPCCQFIPFYLFFLYYFYFCWLTKSASFIDWHTSNSLILYIIKPASAIQTVVCFSESITSRLSKGKTGHWRYLQLVENIHDHVSYQGNVLTRFMPFVFLSPVGSLLLNVFSQWLKARWEVGCAD